jgi:hypothetical protein
MMVFGGAKVNSQISENKLYHLKIINSIAL